jgi:hypothetical protein
MCLLQSYESLNSLNRFCAGLCPISGLELWYLVGFYLGVLYHDEFIRHAVYPFLYHILMGSMWKSKQFFDWVREENTKPFTMWTSNCSLVRNGLCKLHLHMACAYILAKLLFDITFASEAGYSPSTSLWCSPPPANSYKTRGRKLLWCTIHFFLYPYVLLYVKRSVRVAFYLFWIV